MTLHHRIVVILISSSFAVPAHGLSPEEIYSSVSQSVVLVRALDSNGKEIIQGSGVVIGKEAVVTNCHVISAAVTIHVRQSRKVFPATLKYADVDRDLCQLIAPRLAAPSIVLGSSKDLKIGQRVYAIGAPYGLELTLSEGLVSALRDFEDHRYVQFTAPISAGSSGGGLFDSNGRLVGITFSQFEQGQNINFALPADWIADLPRRATSSEDPAKAGGEGAVVWLNRVIALEARRDWAGLLLVAKEWLRRSPRNAFAWFALGNAHNKLKQYDDAVAAFLQSLKISPDFADSWKELGWSYVSLEQWERAITAYDKATRLRPSDPQIWYNMGGAYGRMNRLDEAIYAYREALRIRSDYELAWYSLGVAYIKLAQYDRAVQANREALRIRPQFYEAWSNLSVAYLNLRRFDDAIEVAQEALRINPKSVDAWYNLGVANHSKGERQQLRRIYEALLRLDEKKARMFFDNFVLVK